MTSIADLRADYLERATARIMAMPQAGRMLAGHPRTAGDVACQALAFQTRHLDAEDLADGVDALLSLVGEEDLTTLLEDMADDVLVPKPGTVSLFGRDRLRGRTVFGTKREETRSEVLLGGRYGGYIYKQHDRHSDLLDFAAERVPGDDSESLDERRAAVARHVTSRLEAAIPADCSLHTRHDGRLEIRGPADHLVGDIGELAMLDRTNIDRWTDGQIADHRNLLDELNAEEDTTEYAADDASPAAVQSRINARLGGLGRVIVDEVDHDPSQFWQTLTLRLTNGTMRGTVYAGTLKEAESKAASKARKAIANAAANRTGTARIHSFYAGWLARRIGVEAALDFTQRVADARGAVLTEPVTKTSAKLRKGVVVGCFDLGKAARWKDDGVIASGKLVTSMLTQINAGVAAGSPQKLSAFIGRSGNAHLDDASIMGGYNRINGTFLLKLETPIVELEKAFV